MTENKRFTIVNMGLNFGRFIKKDGKIIELERVVDLLNENEQLKKELTYWKELLDNNLDLQEENEQLKHELHTLTGLYAFDKLGKGVKASDDSVTVPRKDLIKLDYGDVE